jgi:acyl-coenzyme A synthetase/AMP-(fatty) acid ligase
VEFIDALPTTATGKVQRFKLRERAREDHEAGV